MSNQSLSPQPPPPHPCFSVHFSPRRSTGIKKPWSRHLSWPRQPFRGPLTTILILKVVWQCGIAGSEQLPQAQLGWYSTIKTEMIAKSALDILRIDWAMAILDSGGNYYNFKKKMFWPTNILITRPRVFWMVTDGPLEEYKDWPVIKRW